jgi:methylamine dehydrogenase heavy chain
MTIPNNRHRRGLISHVCGLLLGAALLPAAALAQLAPPPATPGPVPTLEPETPFTSKLPPLSPHWAFVRGGFESGATRIFNGDTGKMVGMISTSRWADLGLDPSNRFYYVAETIWSKINRGTRQDMISIYDPTTLALVNETPIAGRLIIGADKNNFVLSNDGKTGFVYNLSPASSVNVVDLEKRKPVQTVELPGCASLMPNPGVGFSALCSDGTMATVALTGRGANITHTAPFFSASKDPIFSAFSYDRAKSEVVFMTYSGLVYQAKIGAVPTVGEPWSLQAAAGLRPGDTKPLDINWLPGGRQPMAVHRASGTLYVLMHMGEFWTQNQGGDEIWVVDVANKKIKRRVPLKKPAEHIEISQDDKPLIFLGIEEGKLRILDGTTFEQKFEVERAGGGVIATSDPR